MKNNKFLISVTILSLITLSSCANYKASSLSSLSSEIMITPSTDEKVLATVKAFTKEDCKRYLDRDVISKGYQPVQIYIQNNSDTNYKFSLDRVSLPCATSNEVADTVHTSTVGRVVGYSIGALCVMPLLVIPAIVDGIKSSKANESLDNDFFAKIAKDQVIHQYSSLNKIIFIPTGDYQQNFNITLIDLNTGAPKTLNLIAN